MHTVQWQEFVEQVSQLSRRQRLIERTAQASLQSPACGTTHLHRLHGVATRHLPNYLG